VLFEDEPAPSVARPRKRGGKRAAPTINRAAEQGDPFARAVSVLAVAGMLAPQDRPERPRITG
jgi:hypothetical protein